MMTHAPGLSGPGRLHDTAVTYEAVSPGEFTSGDMAISYGIHPSPFGRCVIGVTRRGICWLSFTERNNEREAVKDIRSTWPHAHIARDDATTKKYAEHIFEKGASGKPPHLLVRGTDFQVKVWDALLAIPPGVVTDYGSIARAIGAPKAVRAVGSACGKNAIAYLIPCHRVLAGDGGMGGYRWGTERKEAILAWEASQ